MAGMRMAKADKEDISELVEYFKKREDLGTKVPYGWRRVIFGYAILADRFCDSTEDFLAYSPYLEEFHVAPEQ